MTPPQALLDRFGVRTPRQIAKTGIATVWRVTGADGKAAALKLYENGDEQDEGPGLTLLAALAGQGAARLLDRAPGAVLLEYLDGPSLGDLARDGNDLAAARHLADVARRIAGADVPSAGLTPLENRCRVLFDASAPALARVQALARSLLDTAPDPRALHGDLHHDNVLLGPRGWCAIDAKGVWGDPAYELANAFRNPVRMADAIRDPGRLRALNASFADVTGYPAGRLMGWAAVHVCLSILWDGDTPFDDHPDRDLPALYLGLAAEHGDPAPGSGR